MGDSVMDSSVMSDARVASDVSEECEATPIWSDRYELGFAPMDDIHKEFVDLVRLMKTAPESELVSVLDRFSQHAQAHFSEEETWMFADEFPARDCHKQEHDAVLDSVYEVRNLIQAGHNPAMVRDLAKALEDWFPLHATYMDSALAAWMFKKEYGGRPVVFRRMTK